MALNSRNMSVMAYANGFTLWTYCSTDSLSDIKASNYFNNASPFVKAGDMILINASTGGTLEPAILAVSSVSGGVVTVSDFIASAIAAAVAA